MKQANNSQLIIESNLGHLKTVADFSGRVARQAGLTNEQAENLAIALTEIVSNAIVHGNKENPQKKVTIRVTYYPDRVQISVKDEGAGFDPTALRNPTRPENLWLENGRGIFLARNLIDELEFIRHADGMEVILIEYKESSTPPVEQ